MPGKEYGWIRYCSEHAAGLDTTGNEWVEEGFLATDSIAERLDRIGDVPCLILLGEPGEGKSKELERLASPARPMRLEAYSDEGRLRDDLRQALSQAERGNERVWLFLDSLDEVLFSIRTAADVLLGELERVRPYLGAIRLRLTCRTGAWPATLETRLRALWDRPEDVIRRTLLPLTRADVEEAALNEGLNANALIREIERAGIVPLARRPATLLMLFDLYRQQERLPSSRWTLYDQATRLLATEPLERDERSNAGVLLPSEHRAVAALIATVMVLGNYAKVSRRIGVAEPGELDPALVCGWDEELEDGRRRHVDESAVKEVLRGGLFAGAGLARHFGHRTFGEFLCAWRLARQSISLEAILDLLRARDALIRPQLHELAGWIAAARRDLWEWLAEHEPSVLLLGDTATASSADRKELTEALLNFCHQRRLMDHIGGWDEHLDRLDHPELPQQLATWIARDPDGTTKDIIARRVAFRIALECAWWRLRPNRQPPLEEEQRWRLFAEAAISLALDPNENNHLRTFAVRAIDAFGTTELIRRLKPLLNLPRAQDPDLDLKGLALRALWLRRIIHAEELFQHLRHPGRRRGYFGSYWFFVETELAPSLGDDELASALEWVAKGRSPEPTSNRSVRRMLMERAWQASGSSTIQKALISAIAALISSRQDLGLSPQVIHSDPEQRRRILLGTIRAIASRDKERPGIVYQSLAEPADLPWLLDLHRKETEEPIQEQLRFLIRLVLNLENPQHGPLILDACAGDPLLARSLGLLEPVQLDDPDVVRQRKLAKRDQERRAKGRVRAAKDVVNDQLRRNDGDAWWELWHSLALKIDTDQLADPWNQDPTELPGWKADPSLHPQIRDVAERYLRSRDPQTAEWLGTDNFTGTVLAGIAAVQVVATDPKRLNSLGVAVWRRWTPALVAHSNGLPDSVRAEAIRQVPEVVAETLRIILTGKQASIGKAFAIEHSVDWWCPPLLELLHPLATEPQDAAIDRAVLRTLAKTAPAIFATIAWARLDQNEINLDLRANAAAALYQHQGELDTRRWWTALSKDEAFAHKVLALISERTAPGTREQRADMPADVLESLYLWLIERYPPKEDPGFGDGARFFGPRDHIAYFRDSLAEFLGSRATAEDLIALERLESRYPDRLRWTLAKARMQHRAKGWQGWAPAELKTRFIGLDSAPNQPAPILSMPPRTEFGMIDIDDLFPERSFPKHTYIPLPQHVAIRRILEGRHKALLVEGPAATGKTLAVQYALDELKIPATQRHEFPCADPSDRRRLRIALDKGLRTLDGYLIVDDVHCIDDEQLRKDLIGAVKTAVDIGKGPRCALIGTNVGIRSLLASFQDANNSVEAISVSASEETLVNILRQGAEKLNVEVDGATTLVELVGRSTQIMQLACNFLFRSLLAAGGLPSRIAVDANRIRELLLDRFVKLNKLVERFVSAAGEDSDQRGVAVALLWALGQSPDACVRRDKLPTSVSWNQRADELEQVFATKLSVDLPFRIDDGVLSVEDLRIAFLLRNWDFKDWFALAVRLGAKILFQPGNHAPTFPARELGEQGETQSRNWRDHRDIILRSLRCKDFHENVYLLGSTERRVTFYAQQCRALSLVHALLDSRALTPGSRLGIVGGGLSGMTAAVAAARKGCQVTLFEKAGKLMSRQAGATHRWVHPQIYDALVLAEDSGSRLPVLPWTAGPASNVVEQIRAGWESEMRALPDLLDARTNQPVIGLEKTQDGKIRIVTDGPQERAFSVVVVAIGFGPEKIKIGRECVEDAPSYWDNDLLSSQTLTGSILVSGAGDGGLVDLARALIVGFNHEEMLRWILKTDALTPLRRFMMEKEGSLNNDELPTEYARVLRELPELRNLFRTLPPSMELRTGVKVTFVYKENPFDSKATSPVNRMITALLLELRNDAGDRMVEQNSRGLLGWLGNKKVKMSVGGRTVERTFDHIIARHGPDQDYVWQTIEVLKQDVLRMRGDIRDLDLSRRLHPQTQIFFTSQTMNKH